MINGAEDPVANAPTNYGYYELIQKVNNTDPETLNGMISNWASQVINGTSSTSNESIENHLSTIDSVLEGGTDNLILSCTTIQSPSDFTSSSNQQLDTAYYNGVYSLLDYFYQVQAMGMTMVVEASNYEAWYNAGSPVYNSTTTSDQQNVTQIQNEICGSTTYNYIDPSVGSDTAAWCQAGIQQVVGANGSSGVRGRVASQLNKAGAGFTQPNIPFPTHHYIGDNILYASDVNAFTATNSADGSCTTVDSNSPCGLLSGTYDNTTIGGDYGPYGKSSGYGSWEAISSDQMHYNFNYPAPDASGTVASFLETKGYVNMPTGAIFLTHNKFTIQPINDDNDGTGDSFDAIAFTDTGMNLKDFPHGYYDDHILNKYVSGYDADTALMIPNSDDKCDGNGCHFIANPNLPLSNNNNFYASDMMLKTHGTSGDNNWGEFPTEVTIQELVPAGSMTTLPHSFASQLFRT
ncbi:MAG: hypothetical protein SGILL_004277 [Bacillariaceae sp.]